MTRTDTSRNFNNQSFKLLKHKSTPKEEWAAGLQPPPPPRKPENRNLKYMYFVDIMRSKCYVISPSVEIG
jgi:hypothetical protein